MAITEIVEGVMPSAYYLKRYKDYLHDYFPLYVLNRGDLRSSKTNLAMFSTSHDYELVREFGDRFRYSKPSGRGNLQ